MAFFLWLTIWNSNQRFVASDEVAHVPLDI